MFEHIHTQQIRLIGFLIFAIGIVQPIFSQVSTQEKWKNEPFGSRQMEKELIQKRDKNSKHFVNADGTISAHLAAGELHYWENNQWKTIFHTIEQTALGFQNIDNSFKSFFPKTASGSIRTSLSDGSTLNEMVGMRMYFADKNNTVISPKVIQDKPGRAHQNELIYANAYGSGIDLRLTQQTSVRKMDYIIHDLDALGTVTSNMKYLVFEELIELPAGWSAKLVKNTIQLMDQKGRIVAVYEKPLISDTPESHHDHEDTDPNHIHQHHSSNSKVIESAIFEIFQQSNVLTIRTKVPFSWLKDERRNFPIFIDPTINFTPDNASNFTGSVNTWTTGLSSPGSFTSTAIHESFNDRIFLGHACGDGYYDGASYVAGSAIANSSDVVGNGWMKFNTTSVPSSCINSASVHTYVYDGYATGPPTCKTKVRVRNMSGDPVSQTNAQRLTDIRDGTVYADFDFAGVNGAWRSFNLNGSSYSDILSGTASFGFETYETYLSHHEHDYVMIRGYSHANKPYMVVDYKPNYQVAFSNLTPVILCAGQTYDLTVTVTNSGCLPWTSGWTPPNSVNFCWWGSWQAGGLAGGQENNPRVQPFTGLAAGASQNITFTITAPTTPGAHSIQMDLVRDGVCWFRGNGAPSCGPGNIDFIVPITVVPPPPVITGNTTLCVGTPSQLSVNGWTPPTGGTITSIGNDLVHTFTANGTFTTAQSISNASILLVGGGGGGGTDGGGGGGGGRVVALTGQTISGPTHAVTRGGGGAGVAAGGSGVGATGGTSSVAGIAGATATGGLGGASSGGVGGNSAAGNGGGLGHNGTGTYNPSNGNCWRAGGGGAGNAAAGTAASHTYVLGTYSSVGGNAGNGTNNNFQTGTGIQYGKGGAGATASIAGSPSVSTCGNMAGSAVLTYGTTNNGGGGVNATTGAGNNGAANRGGGGGGAINGLKGGNGGTGLVVIRYSAPNIWSSSNPAVATVDPLTGLVTPIATGTTVITCAPVGGICISTVTITVGNASSAATSVSGGGNVCHGQNVVLSPAGATAGTNTAHVWYKGGCNNAFTETWSSMNYGVGSTTVNSLTNGILNVSSTSGDPMIHMNNIGSFDPTIYRYINIRYRVTSGAAGGVEIFFHNASHNFAVGGETGYGTLISDGNWHVLSVDMHTDPDYLTGGNILGWRYDWATANSVTMDLDFIQLSQFPMIDEDNTTPQLLLNYGSTHYPAAGQTQTFATSIIDNCGATSCVSTTVSSPSTSGNLGNNNDQATCVVNQNGWVHFYHSSGRLLASINSGGTDLGNVTVTSYDDGAPVSVFACDEPTDPVYRMHTMERHWLINPTTNGPAKVRLPFYTAEYDAMATAANGNANPNDQVTGVNTVRLSKYSGGVSNTNEDANAPNNCPGAGGTGNTIVVLQDLYGTSDVSAFPQAVGASSYVEYSISGFSEFWLHGASSSPLPVELVSFSGNCMSFGVQLDWSTASEQNNAYFEVQRSRDLQLWETIAHVNGAGNSSQLLGYQYIDQEALEAAYYRIVQVDYNGDHYIKNTVHITCSGPGSTVSVYPNPTQADFTVKVNADKMSENARIILFDVTGKRIIDRPIAISKGVNEFYFDTVLETGSYLVKVFTDFQEFEVVKFVVKH